MPRSAATTRRRIVGAAYELFYRKGFARVSVDAIAAQAGVTKRTIYAHFDSKDRLLAAVLDRQHDLAVERVRTWSARLSGNADAMLAALFADLAAWAARPRWSGAGFTRSRWSWPTSPTTPPAPSPAATRPPSSPGSPKS